MGDGGGERTREGGKVREGGEREWERWGEMGGGGE